MNAVTTTLPVKALEVCARTRVRKLTPNAGSDIVLEYADAYRSGLILEPLDVFREKRTERYIVADGEHRLLALRRAEVKNVECRLYEGDEVAALDFAIGCNQRHGLRRTKADVYHVLARIMETPQLRDKYRTDSELSEKLGISVRTVQNYRAQWRNSEGGDARVRAAKDEARQQASRHPGRKVEKPDMKASYPKNEQKQPFTSESSRIDPAAELESTIPSDDDGPPPGVTEEDGISDADEDERLQGFQREHDAAVDRVLGSAGVAELKRQAAEIASLKVARDGFENGKGAITKLLKDEQAKVRSLGRKLDAVNAELARKDQEIEKLREENEALRERICVMEEGT
jgi:ParB-like chromosome segregation protein Spo0J